MAETFTARSPGRVNLIGEHTDYNGGMVLPAALSIGIEVSLEPRADNIIGVASNQYEQDQTRETGDAADGSWSDPSVGAVRVAVALGLLSGGANIAINSTMPHGAGLSSSAALIVAVLKAARASAGSDISDVDLALSARRVENDFLGVPCGIMDQLAVALATPGNAMALDTKTLDWNIVPLLSGYDFAVIHSGVTRKLTDGRYAERKVECDAAKAYFGTDDLCLLDRETVEAAEIDPVVKRRALHTVTEHERVKKAVAAMQANDAPAFAELMNDSHISMRDLFEMSVPQIDALVESAVELGAIGARLTGGGFGGCIVACVAKAEREAWLNRLLEKHPDARFIDAA